MAINYPTSLDTFTNPTATSLLTSPSHSGLHSDINDAVEALETKVGIGNTVLGTYTTYTPTYQNITIGNATVTAKYCQVNDFVHVTGSIVLGSTTVIGTNPGIGMGFNVDSLYYTPTTWLAQIGTASFYDVSAGSILFGVVTGTNNATIMQIWTGTSNGANVGRGQITATAPFTWATGDEIKWNVYFKKA